MKCQQQPATISRSAGTILIIIRDIIRPLTVSHKFLSMGKARRRQSENASRRKSTLIKKIYEYGELSGADVALIIYNWAIFHL
jgi:hypothetical protein